MFEVIQNMEVEMKDGERKIIYALTDVCNWRCLHCYKRLSPTLDIARPIDKCKKDIKVLQECGYNITLGGAENLTDRNYLEIYGLVGQKYILSNGVIPSRDKELCADLVTVGIECVHISWHIGLVDALKSVPESIVKRAVDNILKAGLKVMILCDVGSLNYNLLVQISAEAKRAGATAIKFMQLLPTNDLAKNYLMTTEQKRIAIEQIRALREYYEKNDLHIGVSGTFNATDLTEKRVIKSAQGVYCPAGKDLITIDTDNKVYPCPFLAQPQFQIGTFEDGQLIIYKTIPNDGKNCLAESQLILQHNLIERRLA